jgi:hypothetical protein
MSEKKLYFKANKVFPICIQYETDHFLDNLDQGFRELGFGEQAPAETEVIRTLAIQNISRKSWTQNLGKRERGYRSDFETLASSHGGQLYLYRGEGAMMFSTSSEHWKMGVTSSFGSDPLVLRVIMARFLSWSLQSFGITGHWGLLGKSSIFIDSVARTQGKCVFFDAREGIYFAGNRLEKVIDLFPMVRFDPSMKHSQRMTREELYSFLMTKCASLVEGKVPQNLKHLVLELTKVSLAERSGSYEMRDLNESYLPN